MTDISHHHDWLIELLEQNEFISIRDGLGTFVHKTNYGWVVCGRDDAIQLLDCRIFGNLSTALNIAKSLHAIFTEFKATKVVACVRHTNG